MPDEATSVLSWLSEATLAGLLAYILYGSSRKKWYWDHYVLELQKDRDEWKHMALELLQSTRTLVNTAERQTRP